jgi:hypothetical protein
VRSLLARDHDVQDLVHPVLAPERMTKLALADREGSRLPVAVEDTWDKAAPAQAPGRPASTGLALRHFEPDSVSSHTGPEV